MSPFILLGGAVVVLVISAFDKGRTPPLGAVAIALLWMGLASIYN